MDRRHYFRIKEPVARHLGIWQFRKLSKLGTN